MVFSDQINRQKKINTEQHHECKTNPIKMFD